MIFNELIIEFLQSMQNLRDNVLIIYIYAVLILVLYIEIFDTEIILKLYAVIEIP